MDRQQRDYLGKVLERVSQALDKLSGKDKEDSDDDDIPLAAMYQRINKALKQEDTQMSSATVLTLSDALKTSVNKVASKIEEALPKVLSAAPSATPIGQPNGSATIKQVRKAVGKLLSAKPVAQPPHPM